MRLRKIDAFPNAPGLSESMGLMEADALPPETIGWGPWKRRWHSICSGCRDRSACPRCRVGSYSNVWWLAARSLLFRISPRLWRWLANR